jgi:hypothetical protein
MSSKRNASASFAIPNYSRIRVYNGAHNALDGTDFSTIPEFVEAMNAKLIEHRILPVSCGDYPTSEKKLTRLVKRWESLQAKQNALTNAV